MKERNGEYFIMVFLAFLLIRNVIKITALSDFLCLGLIICSLTSVAKVSEDIFASVFRVEVWQLGMWSGYLRKAAEQFVNLDTLQSVRASDLGRELTVADSYDWVEEGGEKWCFTVRLHLINILYE
jgi:hypothetical protein